MSNNKATNAVIPKHQGKRYYAEVTKDGIPLDRQIPMSYQLYNGAGNDTLVYDGSDVVVVLNSLIAGNLIVSFGNSLNSIRNLKGRKLSIVVASVLVNQVIVDYTPGNIILANTGPIGFTYTIPAGVVGGVSCIFFEEDQMLLYVNNGGGGPPGINIYNSDGTLTSNRVVNMNNDNLSFTNAGNFDISGNTHTINTNTILLPLVATDATKDEVYVTNNITNQIFKRSVSSLAIPMDGFCSTRITSQQILSIPNNIIIFNSVTTNPENFNINNMYDIATGLATIPSNGYYNYAATVPYTENFNAAFYYFAVEFFNVTTNSPINQVRYYYPGINDYICTQVSGCIEAIAGEQYCIRLRIFTPITPNMRAGVYPLSSFSMYKIK